MTRFNQGKKVQAAIFKNLLQKRGLWLYNIFLFFLLHFIYFFDQIVGVFGSFLELVPRILCWLQPTSNSAILQPASQRHQRKHCPSGGTGRKIGITVFIRHMTRCGYKHLFSTHYQANSVRQMDSGNVERSFTDILQQKKRLHLPVILIEPDTGCFNMPLQYNRCTQSHRTGTVQHSSVTFGGAKPSFVGNRDLPTVFISQKNCVKTSRRSTAGGIS